MAVIDRKRNYLTPFLESPGPWLVLARNAVPVIGYYQWGWPAGVIFFQIWFDSICSLGAMIGFQMWAFTLNDLRAGRVPMDVPKPWLLPVMSGLWLFLTGLLGAPLWFMLVFFSFRDGVSSFFPIDLQNAALRWALIFVLLCNIIEQAHRRYDRMDDRAIRLEFGWDMTLLITRAGVLILSAVWMRLGAILPVMLALSFLEIYPMRALRWTRQDVHLEPENLSRSAD